MLVIRCTQKLLKHKPGPSSNVEDDLEPALGNWHANLVRIDHWPIVLCVNDFSLLSIILPGRNFPNFASAFQNSLRKRLERMDVSQDRMLAELAAIQIIKIERTNSKSVLGSMNDFVLNLRYGSYPFNPDEVTSWENELSQTPMGALKYSYPVEVAFALLSASELNT